MNTTPNPTTPDTVVLIHGLWLNARSWEPWIERYEQRGLRVIAKSWPEMDGDIAALRADTSAFDDLGIEAILDHYTQIINDLEQPPIIIGHSFGGAFTQVLVDRGLGAAGVAIDSGPVKGILKLPLSQLRAGFPILKNPLNRHRAVPITADEFHYAFTNTLSDEESATVYEQYWVPGPGRVLFEGALANLSPHSPLHVDFGNAERAPLLLIAGGDDHTAPQSTNESNYKHYKSDAVTELKVYPGRAHFHVGLEGWEEVADYAIDWSLRNAR